MLKIASKAQLSWGHMAAKMDKNDAWSWPLVLSPKIENLNATEILTCHPQLRGPYTAWSKIKRRKNQLPARILESLQKNMPIPVMEHRLENGQKTKIFIGNFHWVNEVRLTSTTVVHLKSRFYQDRSVIDFLVRSAWLEVIDLIRTDIDLQDGIFQWQWVMNDQLPVVLLEEVMCVSTVTLRMLSTILGISESKLNRWKSAHIKRKNALSIPQLDALKKDSPE